MDQNSESKRSDYNAIIINRIIWVIVVSVIPLILVSSIILYQFRASYREKVHAHLATLVKRHKLIIDAFLTEKRGNLRFVAKSYTFDELRSEPFLKERLETMQMELGKVFVDLGVINAKGIQVAYAGPFKLGNADYSDAEWFQNTMRSESVISDVFLGLRGFPHFIIAVKDNRMGEPWILRATIDFAAFNNLVEKIRVGETGFAFILNREMKFQTKPLQDVMLNKGPYRDLLKGKNGDEVQIVEATDGAGNRNIYLSAFLKQGDWLLVYRQRASDAFSDLQKALEVALVIIFLGSVASVSMAYIRAKSMVIRMAKSDEEKLIMSEQIVETGKLASVGELASGIAHEINNPVAIMVEEAGWIQDLLQDEEFGQSENLDEFQRALNQIRTQGERCKEITTKLLSFARKTDARIQVVQLNDLLEELVGISAQRAKYSNVTINMDIQQSLPPAKVSQTEMQQVFLNIITNALDAMENTGGSLDVSTRRDDGFVVVELADNGPGIPEANITRIFDPFFTTKPVGKGTGLGLSICYGIIKKLGGDIIVNSQVGAGTTFRVNIPLTEKEETKGEDSSETSQA